MYYKIVEYFGPKDDGWKSYVEFRGIEFHPFDSVGRMRPNLFTPESDEDWSNCVSEEYYKENLITNLAYAKEIFNRYKNAVLVGVDIELDDSYVPKEHLLGYDIIDGYCDVSLLTNWGNDEEGLFTDSIQCNGLLNDLDSALRIRDTLREKYPEDGHADYCEVWAVYRVDT